MSDNGPRKRENAFSTAKWIAHFRHNASDRVEPEWDRPLEIEPEAATALVRSLEQFQLGDGGGPACLIAHNANEFRESTKEMRELVDAWFAEEREHSRLLGAAVKRFNGKTISSHWSFTAFCWCRRILGVRFELQVLLLTEIVSTVYYRVMRRHVPDVPIRQMCSLILRDESGHVAFHRDRLAAKRQTKRWVGGECWQIQFWLCGLAAGTMLWLNHAPALKKFGGKTVEFYREITLEISKFLRRLERRSDQIATPETLPVIKESVTFAV